MPAKGQRKVKAVFKCDQCPYKTERRLGYEDHLRVHSGERPFGCSICGKCFTQKSNLGQHLKVHGKGDQRTFNCPECDFTTKWKTSIKSHLRWHRGEKPFKCHVCGKGFSQSSHCKSHIREAHSDERCYKCSQCGKGFKRQEHLLKHQSFHTTDRKFECDICHKCYLDEDYLNKHKLIHMGEASKKHHCDLCPYKSRYGQALRIHYRTHTGARPYKCESCRKTFVTSQSLNLHVRMVHQGEAGKIFRCEKCAFATANKQSLKHHMERIHLGVKAKVDAQCVYCGKCYKSMSALYGHKKKKHPALVQREREERAEQRLKKVIPANKILGTVSMISTSSMDTGEVQSNSNSEDSAAKAVQVTGVKLAKTSSPDRKQSSSKRILTNSQSRAAKPKSKEESFTSNSSQSLPPPTLPCSKPSSAELNIDTNASANDMFQPVVELEMVSFKEFSKEVSPYISMTDDHMPTVCVDSSCSPAQVNTPMSNDMSTFVLNDVPAKRAKKGGGAFSSGKLKIKLSDTVTKLKERLHIKNNLQQTKRKQKQPQSLSSLLGKKSARNTKRNPNSGGWRKSAYRLVPSIKPNFNMQPNTFKCSLDTPSNCSSQPKVVIEYDVDSLNVNNESKEADPAQRASSKVSSFGSLRELAQTFVSKRESLRTESGSQIDEDVDIINIVD